MIPDIQAAAAARAGQVAQRSHRPSQRRNAPESGVGSAVRFRSQLAVREADADPGGLHFTGYASVYESAYEMWDMFGPYSEVVSAGAAAESLNRADLDVPLVLGHDSLRRIARTTNGTLTLTEDEHGLHVDAPGLDPEDRDVAYIAPKIRAGLIDEMSFMFRITRGTWSPDYTEYRIDAFDIHRGDVAIVGYGANPATDAALRTAGPSREALRARLTLAAAL